MDIKQYLADKSDDDLLADAGVAVEDLKRAAEERPGSEWHDCCFAGAVVLLEEIGKRGLKLHTVH
jgi:hypothetical protein